MASKQYNEEIILENAFELCSKTGLMSLSVRRLAKKIGCSVMPIYDSFDSKEGLIEALANYAIDKSFPTEGFGSFNERCTALLEFALDYPLFYIDLVRLNSTLRLSSDHIEKFVKMMRSDKRLSALSLETLNKINSTVELQIMGMILWESSTVPINKKRRDSLHLSLVDFIDRIINSYSLA